MRGQPSHLQVSDVVLERAVVQQIACDVVEPEALAQVVEQLGCLHRALSIVERIEASLRCVCVREHARARGHRTWLTDKTQSLSFLGRFLLRKGNTIRSIYRSLSLVHTG